MHSISIPAQRGAKTPRLQSRRLLALVGDERLVEQIRRGNEAAFEVAYLRYGKQILAFCRHMLGSREEAEDAVQHTFAAAYRQLLRDDRAVVLKPWLFTIAKHRCVSILRARHEHAELGEIAVDGLSDQVERRAELRELLADVAELPAEQRAALLLAETADFSHAEIATVLGCEVQQVKALVYRARSSLIVRREARDLPCEQVRERLATLRGGSLRRAEIVHHLKACAGCQEYRAEIKRQRTLLATALPVTPTAGLKMGVLGAIGGGGAAGGGAVVAGGVASGLSGAAAAKVLAIAGAAAAGAIGVGAAVAPPAGDPLGQASAGSVAPGAPVADVMSVRPMHSFVDRGPGSVTGIGDRPGGTGRQPRDAAPVTPGRSFDRDARRVPPGHVPPGRHAGRVPPGRKGNRVPPGRDANRVPPGRDAARVPPGRDATRVPPGRDAARVPPGRDANRVPPGRAVPDRGSAPVLRDGSRAGAGGTGGGSAGGAPRAPDAAGPGAGRTTEPGGGNSAAPSGDRQSSTPAAQETHAGGGPPPDAPAALP